MLIINEMALFYLFEFHIHGEEEEPHSPHIHTSSSSPFIMSR